MRFGSFVFPVSHHPENDSAVIDSTLDEIVLAEQIGMHSVWLTEHHFDGAAAHADPLVLGAVSVGTGGRRGRAHHASENWLCRG